MIHYYSELQKANEIRLNLVFKKKSGQSNK